MIGPSTALRVLVAAMAACALAAPQGLAAADSPVRAIGVPLSAGAAGGFNVLLITVDTVRADHIGCYGSASARTPAIDRLAGRGVRFADAVSNVPITLPSHATIMTGVLPPRHGVRLNGFYRLPERMTTLAELLSARGYDTGAVVATVVLEAGRGLDQGFRTYDDRMTSEGRSVTTGAVERKAAEATDAAMAWLDARRGATAPFFLWVHYFDPHDPYDPPEPFRSQFPDSRYDGEIAYMDSEIGRLLGHLDSLGARARTLVVLVADHGEGLGDHGEHTHSHFLYESTMRVPFIIVPGDLLERSYVVEDRVASVSDVSPTILDLLGTAGDLADADGRTLLALPAERSGDGDRAIYMETLWPYLVHGWAPLYAMRRHQDKFISAPWPEYYDLTSDPYETSSTLAGERPPDESEMSPAARELRDRLASIVGGDEIGTGDPIDEKTRRQLMSLGYVSGSEVGRPAASKIEPVPLSAMISRWEARADSIASSSSRQMQMVMEVQQRSVQLDPEDANARRSMGQVYSLLGKHVLAEEAFLEALRLDPKDMESWVGLAESRLVQDRPAGCDSALARARALDPSYYGVELLTGRRLLSEGRTTAALESFTRAREAAPPRDRPQIDRWIERAKAQ